MFRAQHSMRTACRLAGISTHALYRPEKKAKPLNSESMELVRKVVEERSFYGSRRVARSISRNRVRLNRKAIQRIMNTMNWTLPARKRKRAAANTAKPVLIPTAPDRLRETYITYIWCGKDMCGAAQKQTTHAHKAWQTARRVHIFRGRCQENTHKGRTRNG